MEKININEATEWFQVLQTTELVQTAMMTLRPGAASGSKPEAHQQSDQVLLLMKGKLTGQVGDQTLTLGEGDVVIIPAGMPHRLTNDGDETAVTFNTYSPPEYPAATKG